MTRTLYTVRGRREIFTVGDPQVVNVSNIIVHPDFVRESSGVGLNDLVLLKPDLDKPWKHSLEFPGS